jgi:hypothetical protein
LQRLRKNSTDLGRVSNGALQSVAVTAARSVSYIEVTVNALLLELSEITSSYDKFLVQYKLVHIRLCSLWHRPGVDVTYDGWYSTNMAPRTALLLTEEWLYGGGGGGGFFSQTQIPRKNWTF